MGRFVKGVGFLGFDLAWYGYESEGLFVSFGEGTRLEFTIRIICLLFLFWCRPGRWLNGRKRKVTVDDALDQNLGDYLPCATQRPTTRTL